MITLKNLPVTPATQLRKIGWDWMLGVDTLPYLAQDVVVVGKEEAEAYGSAAEKLYEMLIEAGEYVIDQNLFAQLGIPENITELIRYTWEDDRHLHLYGRFDFSGGLNGQPIKLIEFNADTATCIPETAVVQWAHLQSNRLDDSLQFNTLFETLTTNFRRLKSLNTDLAPTLLISSMRDNPEDDTNVTVLGEAAKEAGFTVAYQYIDEVEFSPEEGIFLENEHGEFLQYNFWFKLVPWEYIAYDEPDLAAVLTQMVKNRKAVIINPAYTLLFQSKGILKILWDLYPYHPLLLETDHYSLPHKAHVEKVMFGREGANVKIIDSSGKIVHEKQGEYGDYGKIYQEYTEFLKDSSGNSYQAGVFFAYEACALGYRKGGLIIENTAQFVGHIIHG
ncbi:glutathionylspermidine synthase family protein [Rhodocytophaga aerolata]|uniref:Glutathionylspermidine synthase family protein n=1 Tax=Rhodocytophaga aerolata TaxID=455078 RepID=A0ABT8R9B3_9BACT|nr:glutathionylspermidine synthase family protein [Rhodocytophaga aerolata]MDO1448682.1 glutathionylspermidine synthase family protein [Rhodocytophaga aerolata]